MDMKDIFELIQKFDESSLSEIKIQHGDERISLRKGHEPHIIAGAPMYHAGAPALHAHPAPAVENQGFPSVNTDARSPQQKPSTAEGIEVITAPIVGTFYRTPAPDSPPFVEEGSSVKAGSTICIIEAMKMMNELEADYDLQIVKILVENGAMVEYGSPLFEVKRI